MRYEQREKDENLPNPLTSPQIERKGKFLGSTIPPTANGGKALSSAENNESAPAKMPKTNSQKELEIRFEDLEKRAKEKEESRLKKEKVRKFNLDELDFEGPADVPEAPVDEPIPSYSFLFPSQIVEQESKPGKMRLKEEKKEMPSRVMENAELPVDPQFTVGVEIISNKPVGKGTNDDTTFDEEDSEYTARKDSNGRTVKLRKINLQHGNTSVPLLTSLLTVSELQSRGRSLAIAQFKQEKIEQTKKLLNSKSKNFMVFLILIKFCLKLKRLARMHNFTEGENTPKSSNPNESTEKITANIRKALYSNEKNGLKVEESERRGLDTIFEKTDQDLFQENSSSQQYQDLLLSSGQFEDVYLDMNGLTSFMDTLDNINYLQPSSPRRKLETPKRKKKRHPKHVGELQSLLYQGETIEKKRTRQLQKELLRKSFYKDS